MTDQGAIKAGEIYVPCQDLKTEMPYFLKTLGFRLEEIYPADDPAVAVISGHGMRLRLDRDHQAPQSKISLRVENPGQFADGKTPGQFADGKTPGQFADGKTTLTSPSGNLIDIVDANPGVDMPETQHSFMVRHMKDSDAWVIGRAGMHYRDLIPNRLGGSIIASHIRIPDGGPVPDMIHYHTVGFQLIFCLSGWVRLVYEDQGPPFVLEAGNCVIQPPEIRHQVLEASDNVEVLEIGVPAEHVTTIDHDMALPNDKIDPGRIWQGTRFIHHKAADGKWTPWRLPGWEARDTGIGQATTGIAGVQVARPSKGVANQTQDHWSSHDADIHFTMVARGSMTLEATGENPHTLEEGDAFVLPPYLKTSYKSPSADCELIEIALKADFSTDLNDA